jgi:hypothetical protein
MARHLDWVQDSARFQAFFPGLSALPAQLSAAGWLRVFSAPGRVRACAHAGNAIVRP